MVSQYTPSPSKLHFSAYTNLSPKLTCYSLLRCETDSSFAPAIPMLLWAESHHSYTDRNGSVSSSRNWPKLSVHQLRKYFCLTLLHTLLSVILRMWGHLAFLRCSTAWFPSMLESIFNSSKLGQFPLASYLAPRQPRELLLMFNPRMLDHWHSSINWTTAGPILLPPLINGTVTQIDITQIFPTEHVYSS